MTEVASRRSLIELLGLWVSNKFRYYIELATLLFLAFKELILERGKGFSLVWEITLRQIYFTGVEALKVVAFVSLALGTLVIVEAGSQMDLLGGLKFICKILILVIIRELGSLLTAFIVIGRSGTAIATELGNMIVAQEIDALRVMGINPIYFLVTPRIIGVTIAVFCLTVFFYLVALCGGFLVSMLILPVDFTIFLKELMTSLTGVDLSVGFLKSLAFGLLISLTCTYHGLNVRYSPIEVPQVATKGVVSAILACIIFNVTITIIFYL